jgi:nicotinate-nucleotide pyrophosphorylase (carboxylating)
VPRVDQTFALREAFDQIIAVALHEDLQSDQIDSDVTTMLTVDEKTFGEARLTAKQAGVICGLEALHTVYRRLDGRVEVKLSVTDGDDVAQGDLLATIEGPARPILVGERPALNLIGHLSGIASLVRTYARVVRDNRCVLVDTRKTLPGLRSLEKYAVRVGGGANHRFGLWDGILVKDNHIVAAGSVGEATSRARAGSAKFPVQVECTNTDEVNEALDAGAHAILLDNQEASELVRLTKLIKARNEHILVEASGGITIDNVAEVAATGVDRISVGAFTHSAPALDISMKLEKVWST